MKTPTVRTTEIQHRSQFLRVNRERGWTVAVAIVTGLAWLGNHAQADTAVRSNDFLNSIGASTHMSQGEDDPAQVAATLNYTGIRVIRDDGSTSPEGLQKFIDVHQASGAKVSLLPITGNIAASLAEYETLAGAGALLDAEGPNEPNNERVTYQGAVSSNKTSLPVAHFQSDLYAAVKADPKLAGIPVFDSSESGGSEPDNCGLQFLTIPSGAGCLLPDGTQFADYANTHNYVCGHGLKGITQDNIAWDAEDPTLRGTWDGLDCEYGRTWWGKGFQGYSDDDLKTLPRVTTETGWVTQGKPSDHPLTEEQQGKLFVNLYLDAFKRGWSYTFVYMLHDSGGQGYWGFVHRDYSPKASANYLHNLTTVLADKGSTATSFTPAVLHYSVDNAPGTVHDLLLQKSNGTFELAVWGEQAKGSSDASVSLGATYPTVKVYDTTAGTTPIQTLANVSLVPLSLSDHAYIIEIPPAAAQPSATAPVTNLPDGKPAQTD